MVAYRLRERVAALLASEGRSVADDLAARRIDPYAASARWSGLIPPRLTRMPRLGRPEPIP